MPRKSANEPSVPFIADEATLPVYLKQIGKAKPFSQAEEGVLARKIRKNDQKYASYN